MKIAFLIMCLAGTIGQNRVQAQEPVQWTYSVKRIAPKHYLVHLLAKIEQPWHIYSTGTPPGGPQPTHIHFRQNPMWVLTGPTQEIGKMEKIHDDILNIDEKYFENTIDFVSEVELKADVKTNISGTISYMSCTDDECLPPVTTNFNVAVGGTQ